MTERGRPLPTGSSALLGLTELNKRFTALQKEFAELIYTVAMLDCQIMIHSRTAFETPKP